MALDFGGNSGYGNDNPSSGGGANAGLTIGDYGWTNPTPPKLGLGGIESNPNPQAQINPSDPYSLSTGYQGQGATYGGSFAGNVGNGVDGTSALGYGDASTNYNPFPDSSGGYLKNMFSGPAPTSSGYGLAPNDQMGLKAILGNGLGIANPGYTGQGIGGTSKEPSFWDHPVVSFLRTAANLTPAGRVANIGINAARGQDVMGSVLGMANPALGLGYSALTSKDPGATLGKAAVGYGANMSGIPGASMVAGMAMDRAMAIGAGADPGATNSNAPNFNSPIAAGIAQAQNTPNTPNPNQGGGGQTNGGFDLGKIVAGLADAYSANQNTGNANAVQSTANNTNNNLQDQMTSLKNMYAPDSPYAKQLAQELMRKDAKAGRLSQYGPRSVELQARLAALAPTVANSMAGLGTAANQGLSAMTTSNNQAQTATAQRNLQLMQLANSSGLTNYLGNGLKSMWSGFTSPNTSAPVEAPQQPTSSDMYSLDNLWS